LDIIDLIAMNDVPFTISTSGAVNVIHKNINTNTVRAKTTKRFGHLISKLEKNQVE
jgi:hypothetical protein